MRLERTDWSPLREEILKWAEGLLGRFEYKPGWVLSLHRYSDDGDSVRLGVEFMAPDSRFPDSDTGHVPVCGVFDIPAKVWESRSEAEFWVWLHRVLEFMERHELDEWFRIDGTLLSDPHETVRIFQ